VARPKANEGKALVGTAPLGSLPEEMGQSAVNLKQDHQVGDIVFWATAAPPGNTPSSATQRASRMSSFSRVAARSMPILASRPAGGLPYALRNIGAAI
jgi:hypothetical protein